ncbi:hypothetical protein [Methylobacterium radiotolerans]|uniref:Uncharacterized protein n=1 Tax=Methylobacterium radiotolerans (strain ATCC 27329 / DSM 1819 / JCM 2831 / NBRC 15690 / NCIMB 10815 / 0-1) TaxID=426355 RepID=B1MA60_METRJ|nr:hypothetical protein [Methylobacterium radiotolerans]ACB28385.1 hypothetical protein Mrad2831_6471 [Methylobacterium radiotolerans JCM 2831]KTS12137.1 hypothetical protein SB3_02340 [Methylobacterium radiotolerans]KTS46306.1 hypothetical protein SB2_17930 [Methylobacterium radiotolerans]GEN01754.1 hypothetical protein MRA01_62930 [Methylobacterium radiotolerans]
MSRELLCRLPVAWPLGCDRRALIDARIDHHLALWDERLARWLIPERPHAIWLSDRVLEVRAAAVTFWAVLTESEVTIFWDAPLAVRLLVSPSRRAAMIEAFQRNLVGDTLMV